MQEVTFLLTNVKKKKSIGYLFRVNRFAHHNGWNHPKRDEPAAVLADHSR